MVAVDVDYLRFRVIEDVIYLSGVVALKNRDGNRAHRRHGHFPEKHLVAVRAEYGDTVRLARRGSVVSQTAGIFKTAQSPLSAEELREEAERAIAEDVVERIGG